MKKKVADKELIHLLKRGDMVAFDKIYNRYSRRLYIFIIRFLKNESDTEEIVQDVFLKLWESREKLDQYTSFDSYVFTIAYNTTINLLRKRLNEKKYLENLQNRQMISNADEIINEIHFNELTNEVHSLIEKLTPRQREVYRLSREKGLTLDEIAKELNISVNTAKNHLVSALGFIKKNIGNELIINMLFLYLFL